jgi:hypothetical protein
MCPPFFSIYHIFQTTGLWKWTVEISWKHIYLIHNESLYTYAAHDALHLLSFDRRFISFGLVAREEIMKFASKKRNSTLGHAKSLSSLIFWDGRMKFLSYLRWLSPVFDLGLRFFAKKFQTLTFFVHNSPLVPSVHFECLTTYKPATIHYKVNPAN